MWSRWTAPSDRDYNEHVCGVRGGKGGGRRRVSTVDTPTDRSAVEVDRNGYGGSTFPLCTARVENRRVVITPLYETRTGGGTTLQAHEWIECRVYDRNDREIVRYVNDGSGAAV